MKNDYSVEIFQCEESGAYVGTSQDIPGLTLEADSIGGLLEVVLEMVPQLIEHNLGLPGDAEVQVTLRVRAPLQKKTQANHRPSPRYVVEESPGLAYA
jgi:hypothetical protein